MRISIHTLGTRGDIQPYLALALGLKARGHEVQLAAPMQFEAMATRRGVGFAPLPGDFLNLIATPEGKAALTGSKGFGAGLRLLKYARPMMRGVLDAEWQAARGFAPDIIIAHPKSLAAPHIAERLGTPWVLASPLPGFTATAAFPTPLLRFATLGPLNRISHSLATKSAGFLFGGLLRDWRGTSLGLSQRGNPPRPIATLYAYSPHVLAKPGDWGDDVLVAGYWFLDHPDWNPDAELAKFLGAGDPPVYIGFGSMPGIDPQRLTRVCVEALERCGKRGLLATGGGALEDITTAPFVRMIAEAPHDRLFACVSAVVHHGGAGTTGAALRAGKPTAAFAFFGDQPFWARRIVRLGVGPRTPDINHLTAENLAEAIVAMDDAAMRERASALGEAIRGEDGVAAAVGFIEATAGSASSQPLRSRAL
ncbi:MAG: glycosyltransferase [Hyphomicrobium sp.]